MPQRILGGLKLMDFRRNAAINPMALRRDHYREGFR